MKWQQVDLTIFASFFIQMRFFLFFFSLFLFIQSFSQVINHRIHPMGLLDSLEIAQYRSAIYNDIPEYYRNQNDIRCLTYANRVVASEANWHFYNDVLSLTVSQEKYLSDVFREVCPDSLINKLDFVVLKGGNYFGQRFSENTIVLEAGAFSEIASRDMLAAYFSHLIAHKILNHGIKWEWMVESGEISKELLDPWFIESDVSESLEIQADSLACHLYTAAGYSHASYGAMFPVLEKMRIEDRLLDYYNKNDRFGAHFFSEGRLATYQKNAWRFKNLVPTQGPDSNFQAIRKSFWAGIQAEALASLEFEKLIRLSFKFHLIDPRNPDHLYFLMESMGRFAALDKKFWNRNFIVGEYNELEVSKKGPFYKWNEVSLFQDFELKYLPIGPQDGNNISAMDYWSMDPKITTNSSAYSIFYSRAKELACLECDFSIAMSLHAKSNARLQLLKGYASGEQAIFKVLANKIANQEWVAPPVKNSGVWVGNFDFYYKNGRSERAIPKNNLLFSQVETSTELATHPYNLRKYISRAAIQKAPKEVQLGMRGIRKYLYYQENWRPGEVWNTKKPLGRELKNPKIATSLFQVCPEFWSALEYFQIGTVEVVQVTGLQYGSKPKNHIGLEKNLRRITSNGLEEKSKITSFEFEMGEYMEHSEFHLCGFRTRSEVSEAKKGVPTNDELEKYTNSLFNFYDQNYPSRILDVSDNYIQSKRELLNLEKDYVSTVNR